MNIDDVISETEDELRRASAELTAVRPAKCLLCYVHRMLEFGCTGLRRAQRYRDLQAPRATALEHRLGQRGGFCDCEIFLNGYTLAPEQLVQPPPHLVNGIFFEVDPVYPDPVPDCLGVRKGSTRGCDLWVRRQRW